MNVKKVGMHLRFFFLENEMAVPAKQCCGGYPLVTTVMVIDTVESQR